jgi:hypothetical protein
MPKNDTLFVQGVDEVVLAVGAGLWAKVIALPKIKIALICTNSMAINFFI